MKMVVLHQPPLILEWSSALAQKWTSSPYPQTFDFQSIVVDYLKGFQSDKNGARALSNITMLARCLSKIGNYDKACKVVNYAEYKYSDRPIAIKRVLNNIKRIAKCKQTYEYG